MWFVQGIQQRLQPILGPAVTLHTKELNLNAADSSDHVCLLLLSLAVLCLGACVKRPWRMDQREAGMWLCEGGLREGSGTL